ncbi:murein hydrolase activator EnvC family protein [Propionivibrio dicarboxylicus]|uniref:Septal ring factor EnvC, activator of murein hydrolases AmiA and AmiB n=1 Tax=Propionivibrio dicarboxylicus TaxID=83767 RepID=A0A1G8IH52_9RHOO|nr:peptidoglycan DD-metalloendopeptidase family protein [Propionivibrio dicarboxylicus]SDI18225.1 Septal ring factor EnvC, activator of murein hydrolases AmiA and AmiB [Propionivibrio dicarboxylicus]
MNRPDFLRPQSSPSDPGAPPARPKFARRQRILAAIISALLLLDADAHAAKEKKKPAQHPATQNEVTAKQGDLKEVRSQIESLRKGIADTEGKRATAADQLKGVEQEISATQRELHALTIQREKIQAALKDLATQSKELENRLSGQQAQLQNLVYRHYVRGTPDTLHTLLNGDNPSQVTRDLYYLSVIGKARSQLVHEIETTLQRKQALALKTREQAQELSAVEGRQREQHAKLLAQREQRKLMLEKISAKISEQRREIGALQRDEKRLTQLIEQLAKTLAAKAAPRKESRPSSTSLPGKTQTPARELVNDSTPEASLGGGLSQSKGQLRLPVKGTVTNRFGAPRQEGNAWKGLFIRAGQGTSVHAIAGGQVVFADWMRGFGNLLIVDHGGGYLSVYGNNDALLKQVGDRLHGGDVIASVGNSGGNPESGLYFELRHNGQPQDPLKWVSLR